MLPSARQVYLATGIPVSDSLAQFADESGFESSTWIGGNNYSGITDGNSHFLTFPSIAAFTQAHIHTLGLDYYTSAREAARLTGDPITVAEAIGRSPWDAGHYVDPELGTPGSDLVRLIRQYNLTQYDAPPTSSPAPDPSTPAPAGETWLDKLHRLNDKLLGIYDPQYNPPPAERPPGLDAWNPTGLQPSVDAWTGKVGRAMDTINSTVLSSSWWGAVGPRFLMILVGVIVIGLAVWSLIGSGKITLDTGGE